MAGLQVEVPWEECVRVEGRDTRVEEDRVGKGSEEDTRKAEGSTVNAGTRLAVLLAAAA